MAKCKRNRNRAKRNFTVKTPTANRNYKDTVFRMLFSDRKNLLSLYNAVNQSDYKNPEDLEIVTLENAIYMGMKHLFDIIRGIGSVCKNDSPLFVSGEANTMTSTFFIAS